MTSKRYLRLYRTRPGAKFICNINRPDSKNAYFNPEIITKIVHTPIVGVRISSMLGFFNVKEFVDEFIGYPRNSDNNCASKTIKFLLFIRVKYTMESINRVFKLCPSVRPQDVYLYDCRREHDCYVPNLDDLAQETYASKLPDREWTVERCLPAMANGERCDDKVDHSVAWIIRDAEYYNQFYKSSDLGNWFDPPYLNGRIWYNPGRVQECFLSASFLDYI